MKPSEIRKLLGPFAAEVFGLLQRRLEAMPKAVIPVLAPLLQRAAAAGRWGPDEEREWQLALEAATRSGVAAFARDLDALEQKHTRKN